MSFPSSGRVGRRQRRPVHPPTCLRTRWIRRRAGGRSVRVPITRFRSEWDHPACANLDRQVKGRGRACPDGGLLASGSSSICAFPGSRCGHSHSAHVGHPVAVARSPRQARTAGADVVPGYSGGPAEELHLASGREARPGRRTGGVSKGWREATAGGAQGPRWNRRPLWRRRHHPFGTRRPPAMQVAAPASRFRMGGRDTTCTPTPEPQNQPLVQKRGAVAHLVERLNGIQEVRSSTLLSSTTLRSFPCKRTTWVSRPTPAARRGWARKEEGCNSPAGPPL